LLVNGRAGRAINENKRCAGIANGGVSGTRDGFAVDGENGRIDLPKPAVVHNWKIIKLFPWTQQTLIDIS